MSLSFNSFLLLFTIILFFVFIIFLVAFLILELLMREKVSEKYADEKIIKDLVKKFHKKLYDVSDQRTDEVLECLKDMEELDSIYYVMVDNNYKVMSEESFIKVKSDILNNILKKKVNDIKGGRNKKEKYKSLLDEIKVCNKRYPLYKNIYLDYMGIIQKKI